MKVITWEWRKRVMADYFIFSWLQFSRHFNGEKHWSWEFHWKGSNAWYHNFRRHVADRKHAFKETRLTIRFGKRLMVIGSVDMKRYYKDVKVLEIKHGGKITYQYIPALYLQKQQFQSLSGSDVQKAFNHLNRDYPNDSWRN